MLKPTASTKPLDDFAAKLPELLATLPEAARPGIKDAFTRLLNLAQSIILELDPRELPEWAPEACEHLSGRQLDSMSLQELHLALRGSIGMLALGAFLQKPIPSETVEQLVGIITAIYQVPPESLVDYMEAKINAALNRS